VFGLVEMLSVARLFIYVLVIDFVVRGIVVVLVMLYIGVFL